MDLQFTLVTFKRKKELLSSRWGVSRREHLSLDVMMRFALWIRYDCGFTQKFDTDQFPHFLQKWKIDINNYIIRKCKSSTSLTGLLWPSSRLDRAWECGLREQEVIFQILMGLKLLTIVGHFLKIDCNRQSVTLLLSCLLTSVHHISRVHMMVSSWTNADKASSF